MLTPEFGEFVIGHQDAPLRYRVKKARFGNKSPSKPGEKFDLWIDISTRDPPAEHPMEILGPPSLRASNIHVDSADLSSVLGRVFEFQVDPEPKWKDPYANLYISHHMHPHYNRISIGNDASGQFVLNWEGECEDINYYDGRAKANRFQVCCALTQAPALDVEAIRECGAYIWDEGNGDPFEFCRCPKCGMQFLLGVREKDKWSVRYYYDPGNLSKFTDARRNSSVCPNDATRRDDLEDLSFEDALAGPWAWAIR